jgi:hypothetical protein
MSSFILFSFIGKLIINCYNANPMMRLSEMKLMVQY